MLCKDITEELIEEIKKSPKSRSQIAEEAGISLRTIEYWIKGMTVPSLDNVQCILAVIGRELCIRKMEGWDEE